MPTRSKTSGRPIPSAPPHRASARWLGIGRRINGWWTTVGPADALSYSTPTTPGVPPRRELVMLSLQLLRCTRRLVTETRQRCPSRPGQGLPTACARDSFRVYHHPRPTPKHVPGCGCAGPPTPATGRHEEVRGVMGRCTAPLRNCGASCGDAGIRTPCLLRAKQALSQMSYIPPPMTVIPYDTALRCWWGILDSNQGPQSYQDCALTN